MYVNFTVFPDYPVLMESDDVNMELPDNALGYRVRYLDFNNLV